MIPCRMIHFKILFLFFAFALISIKAVVGSAAVTRIKINNLDRGNAFDDVLQEDYAANKNLTLGTNFENGIRPSIMSTIGAEESMSESTTKFLPKELIPDKEKGRKLKYKRGSLQFLMKTILALKITMGILLSLGILASKILSWKAVTLSLMAYTLAKIFLLKNLLTGKNSFPTVSPAFLVQSLPNDIWRRQSELPPPYQ